MLSQSDQLNQRLSDLFVLALIYLARDYDVARHGHFQAPRQYDPCILEDLERCGLLRFSPEGSIVCLTSEGCQEARGVLKFLQLQLGPRVGASLRDIQLATPMLLAGEAAYGAGPLTTTELVYALAGVAPRSGRRPPDLTPNILEDPPLDYNRDPYDRRAFQLRVSLSLETGPGYLRSGRECWRTLVVPAGITFLDLHVIIQLAFTWEDEQPFGFLLTSKRKNLLIGEREACGDVALPQTGMRKIVEERASSLRLNEVFPKTQNAVYRYGTKTNWRHSIALMSTEKGLAELGPQLLDGLGDAPPEWVGSVGEFIEFRKGLYADDHALIRALSSEGERGYIPFELPTARQRLAGFEAARAAWQGRLGSAAEEDNIPL